MGFMLGNLSVAEIEKRLGIDFPDDIREFMNQTHQDKASDIEPGKWHCFDIPFQIVFGDIETAVKIFDSVKDRASECKERLHFCLRKGL